MFSLKVTIEDKHPMRWRDRAGVTHAVASADVHPARVVLWTRCDLGDIPAGAAWQGADTVTCQHCLRLGKKT